MPIAIGSADLSDDQFLKAFEECTLPLSCFRHGDHLRFAWLQLHSRSFEDALASVSMGIQKFAACHGVSHIFHHTITTAWVTLLATHHEESFAEFMRINETRLNRDLLHRFWTPSSLASDAARSGWLAPDKAPLPDLSRCFSSTPNRMDHHSS